MDHTMKNIKLLSLFLICCTFSNYVFAETISQNVWFLATNNKDTVAQYQVAMAYNPLNENDDWYCLPHQFYLESNDKKFAGCKDKSSNKYIEFLTKSAENLYPLAQTALGIAYINGELVNKDIKKGLFWLEKAASPIPDKAKFSIGEGTLWLNEQGRKYGVGQAQYVLATLYDKGIDVKTDYAKAIKYYEMASKSYDWGFYGQAQYRLYQLYKNKINDQKKALYWLEKTVKHINHNEASDAPMELVEYFLNGGQIDGSKSEQPNYPWAAKWLINFTQSDSIENEAKQKMAFQLAWFYLNGLGVEKDSKQAAKYYHLGMQIDTSVNYTINPSIQSSNEVNLQEQFLLNVIKPVYENNGIFEKFQYDEIVDKYYPEELKDRQKRIDYTNKLYIENAIKTVEEVFSDNLEDEKDFYLQLEKEILAEYHFSEYNYTLPLLLALSQQRGIAYGFYREAENLIAKSSNELIQLYESALELEPNNPIILYRFGTLYDFIIQDTDTAISYYKQAADLGYATANYRLGVIYYLGKGVEQNYHKAWRYLNLAAQQNYVIAQKFLITIDKSHPEFEWLTTQYINHEQNYLSPTVVVAGQDWLKVQNENNPSPKVVYHFTKHNFNGNGIETYAGCKAAIELATQGDFLVQKELIKTLNNNSPICTAKQELLFSWIDNNLNDDLKKQFLKAKYYKFTKQDKKYQKELNDLAKNKNQYAIIELLKHTRLYYDSRDNKYLSDIKMLLKSGNVNAAELLSQYYYFSFDHNDKRFSHSIYQYTKAILLRNDLANYISDYYDQRFTDPKYIYANEILAPSDIYKIWFELADMHEQGVDIPKNNIFAFVWYSLLAEHNQAQAFNKVQPLKSQLTAEQLTKANNKLNQYRNLYRFLPLTHMELNLE